MSAISEQLTPYEQETATTVDQFELYVFWSELRSTQTWARMTAREVMSNLVEAGLVGSVADLAALDVNEPETRRLLTRSIAVPAWHGKLIEAAKEWESLPEEWRRDVYGRTGATL